jgi:hypothetical protein
MCGIFARPDTEMNGKAGFSFGRATADSILEKARRGRVVLEPITN